MSFGTVKNGGVQQAGHGHAAENIGWTQWGMRALKDQRRPNAIPSKKLFYP